VDRYKGEVPDWALTAIVNSGIEVNEYSVLVHTSVGSYTKVYEHKQAAEDYANECKMGGNWTHVGKRSRFLIAAPISDMEVRRNERVENGRIVKVEDPIVCVEVSGGYVVLAAWGEEGQDPRVFNSNLN
jgi:hypothetical protein